MNTYNWYQTLSKPSWAPPSWLFGPVWSVLYLIIAVTFGTVFYKVCTKEIPWIVALPFILNLVFNAAFSPLQFGLKNNLLATIDILLVLGTLIWAMYALYQFGVSSNTSVSYLWIVYANIPYLLWVMFATVLQVTITILNW
jgi:tryptophan-rich sensory protein